MPAPETRAPSWARIAVVAAGVAAAALLAFRSTYEPDLWWHLAQGRYDAGGHLIRSNVFSFIYADYRQNYTGWLGDLGIYAVWKAFGATGVQAALALTLLAALGVAWLGCRERSSFWTAAAVLVVGIFIVEPRALPRPHVVSFVGMAACAWLIERSARQRTADPLKWGWLVIAAWSSFHVEALFGAAVLGAYGVGELARPASLTRFEAARALMYAVAASLAAFLNPYGIGIVRYLAENALVPQVLNIGELLPPYLPNYRAFFAYVVVGALLMLWQFRTLAVWELLVVAGIGTIAMQHLRFTTLLFVATAPMVARRVQTVVDGGIDGRALVATAMAAAVVTARIPLSAMPRLVSVGERALAPPDFFSADAIAFARARGLRGPVFNSQNLGGYLAWTLYPDATIFQDGRLQAYPAEHIRAILEARDQGGWDALVSGVDWAVLSLPRANELSGVGRFRPAEWATVFRDRAMEIVVRRQGAFGALANATSPQAAAPPAVPAARP